MMHRSITRQRKNHPMMGNQMLGVVLFYCVLYDVACYDGWFIMQIEEHRTMTKTKAYIAIDLKSFYASVECKERNRDPLTTNLVVADQSRTEKTICLAVSPSLKSYGIPGRPRLFEVVQKIKENIYRFVGWQHRIKCKSGIEGWLYCCTTTYGILFGV